MFDDTTGLEEAGTDRVTHATQELRSAMIVPTALVRAEARILARMKPRRAPGRALLWAAGFTAAGAIAFFVLAPTRSYAAELRRIALNGDSCVRQIRTYAVQPDGSLRLAMEQFTDGLHTRYVDMNGHEAAYDGHRLTRVFQGAVTVETQPAGHRQPISAKEIIDRFTSDRQVTGLDVSVQRDIVWNGSEVDRYSASGTVVGTINAGKRSSMVLIADPKTERPIEIDSDFGGQWRSIAKWDYPSDPGLVRLPVPAGARVYDLDQQRASILASLSKPGAKATVGGKSVELGQLWIDDSGGACVVAKADYAYPDNYGPHIDDLHLATEPEGAPFSGRYWIHQPYQYKKQPVQLFFLPRSGSAGPFKCRDRVTLRIPVFTGKALAGWARFDDVPVHRTWSVYYLIRTYNVPFWVAPGPTTGAKTAVAASRAAP